MILIKLRAVLPEKNINRDYELRLEQVLFGIWSVTAAYGRHLTRGMIKHYLFETQDEAQAFLKKKLHKRLNAKNRIGCDYSIVNASYR